MSDGHSLPRLFVGSSVEGLNIAYAIQENLEFDAETTIWSQGIFAPSGNALDNLIRSVERFDFAAFVFSSDDTVLIRGHSHRAVRDNVIFELGLFFGGLGQGRCFFVMPRDEESLRLPTDLLGINSLTYSRHRSDANLVAALGTACNNIRRAFRAEVATRSRASAPSAYKVNKLHDYVALWNGPLLRESREQVREVVLDHYSEEFAAQRGALERVFAFLDGLAEAVLDGAVAESQAREVFEQAVVSFWPVAAGMLAPPNYQDEWWDPPPRLAELYARWKR